MDYDKIRNFLKRQAVIPTFDKTTNTVLYGLYPQKHIKSGNLIYELEHHAKELNCGWYFYKSNLYAKARATPNFSRGSCPTFDDGTDIIPDETYWFRCEPIVWKILEDSKEDNNQIYTLISDTLLDVSLYDKNGSSHYSDSFLREWLNDEFHGTSFLLDDSFIITTNLSTLARTTADGSTAKDNVYLQPYNVFKEGIYPELDTRSKTTEYSRVKGAYASSGSMLGYYWIMPSSERNSITTWMISIDGTLGLCRVEEKENCIRPSIKIKLKKINGEDIIKNFSMKYQISLKDVYDDIDLNEDQYDDQEENYLQMKLFHENNGARDFDDFEKTAAKENNGFDEIDEKIIQEQNINSINSDSVGEENDEDEIDCIVFDEKDFTAFRKVYDWGKLFENSYDKSLEEKLNKRIYAFFTKPGQYDDGKWGDGYFSKKHDFGISCVVNNQKIEIRRTRICGGRGENMRRLFYCFGDQLRDNRFEAKDTILLYISEPKEHNQYQEIAQFLAESIANKVEVDIKEIKQLKTMSTRGKNAQIFYNEYNYIEEEKKFAISPVLTDNQKSLLEDCLGKPPAIIYGAAGTGKTLMSEKLYKALVDSDQIGDNVLYLTFIDMLANHVGDELKKLGIGKNICCTTYSKFTELCFKRAYEKYKDRKYLYRLGISEKREKDFIYFDKWFSGNKEIIHDKIHKKDDIKYLEMQKIHWSVIDENIHDASSIVYLFFRSFNDQPYYRSFTDDRRTEFKNKLSNEKDLSTNQIDTIFKYCQTYENHLRQHNYMDDNISAFILRELFSRNDCPIEKYDAIIIDEMQDLTLPQIHSLTKIVKGHNFFAYGDDNQSINPSLLTMRDAKTHIYRDLQVNKNQVEEDRTNYLTEVIRSSPEVVNYINLLNVIRSKAIGADKAYNQNTLVSFAPKDETIKNTKPAYLLDKDIFEMMATNRELFLNNEIGIITPGKASKDEFLKKYSDFDQNNIFTIEEIKGRERETVILYNFFSSSMDVWKKISQKYYDESRGNKFYSTLYRRFFNRFYVGLTRAKKKVILYEENELPDVIVNCFLKNEQSPLEHIRTNRHLNGYFRNDFTHERWFANAEEYFKLKQYKDAHTYIINAINSLETLKKTEAIDEEVLEKYKRMEKEYNIYEIYSMILADSSVVQNDASQVQTYVDFFIESGKMENANALYEIFFPEKHDLMKALDEKRNNEIIRKYNQIRESLDKTEKEYFGNEVIDSYGKIISQKIGELNHGR